MRKCKSLQYLYAQSCDYLIGGIMPSPEVKCFGKVNLFSLVFRSLIYQLCVSELKVGRFLVFKASVRMEGRIRKVLSPWSRRYIKLNEEDSKKDCKSNLRNRHKDLKSCSAIQDVLHPKNVPHQTFWFMIGEFLSLF